MGDIYSDAPVLKLASDAVDRLLAGDPDLKKAENADLGRYLAEEARNSVDFRSI